MAENELKKIVKATEGYERVERRERGDKTLMKTIESDKKYYNKKIKVIKQRERRS